MRKRFLMVMLSFSVVVVRAHDAQSQPIIWGALYYVPMSMPG